MTVAKRCPACGAAERPAGCLLCDGCGRHVPRALLDRLRVAALAARRNERGALARYHAARARAIREARAGYIRTNQCALFSPDVGAARRRSVED